MNKKDNNPNFGSAPFTYSKMIFSNLENEKIWNESEPQIKKALMSHINQNSKHIQHTLAIEMMAAYIYELEDRISKLEEKHNDV